MKKHKLGALALSFAVASALCVPATAFADYAGSDQATQDSMGTSAADSAAITSTGTETTVTGTIKPTTMSVTIPTTVAFNVDPGAPQSVEDAGANDTSPAQTTKHGQFTSPSNYKVSNLSRVKVYAFISSVSATTGSGMTVAPDLKNAAPNYTGGTAHAQMMIGIKERAAAPADFTTATDWLTTTLAGNYYPFNAANKGEIAASADGGTAVNSPEMFIFGQVDQSGWTAGDKFQIKPVFTVSSSQPA